MVLAQGQQLKNGMYTIERLMGQGVFTESYLARRSDGERRVIKVFKPQPLLNLNLKEHNRKQILFLQEAEKLSRCKGTPHIARAELIFKDGNLFGLPIEYLGSDSLDDRPQRCLKEETALRYIRQIGSALQIVHKEKLVHRDIRPANIFLRIREGQAEAVLTNFELAVETDLELTRTRRAEITNGYSPIELYSSGEKIRPYTDVYSLAATLYQLLTGVTPISAFGRKAQKQELRLPHELNPDISEKVGFAIATGMALNPQDRPQSMAAWLALLEQKPQQRRANRVIDWGKWGAIATIAGVIVTVGLWAFDKLGSDSPPNPQPTPTEQPSTEP